MGLFANGNNTPAGSVSLSEAAIIEKAIMQGIDEDTKALIESVYTLDESECQPLNEEEFAQFMMESDIKYYLSSSELQSFIESAEFEALVEAKKLSRKTIVRLNKEDDLSRRTKLAALQLAKEKDDPIWKKLVLNRQKERQYVGVLVKKYGMGGAREAKKQQREFQKTGGAQEVIDNFKKNNVK